MTARDRARVRALAQMVACDIHPLNNLRVLQYFEHTWNVPQAEREDWVKHWIVEGFTAVETVPNRLPLHAQLLLGRRVGDARHGSRGLPVSTSKSVNLD